MPLPAPLVERFVRHLAGVLAEVVSLEAELASSQLAFGDGGLERLRAAAHKLAGTAEAYGFPLVGESARQVEAAILDDARGTPALADRVAALREALKAAVRQA